MNTVPREENQTKTSKAFTTSPRRVGDFETTKNIKISSERTSLSGQENQTMTSISFTSSPRRDGACKVPAGAHTVSLPPATPSEISSPSKEINHLVTIIVPVAIITLIILSLTSYLIFRRRREQNNRRKRQTEKQEEFEEHINDVYQSSYHGTSHSNENT